VIPSNDNTMVYCGVDCTKCGKYAEKICEGCKSDQVSGECLTCEPRSCCRAKEYQTCGHCPDYPCSKIEQMFAKWISKGFIDGAKICSGILDEIKNKIVK